MFDWLITKPTAASTVLSWLANTACSDVVFWLKFSVLASALATFASVVTLSLTLRKSWRMK